MADINAKPKCPNCGAEGMEHIKQANLPKSLTRIIYCDACGHIYGVVSAS